MLSVFTHVKPSLTTTLSIGLPSSSVSSPCMVSAVSSCSFSATAFSILAYCPAFRVSKPKVRAIGDGGSMGLGFFPQAQTTATTAKRHVIAVAKISISRFCKDIREVFFLYI